MVTCGSRIDHSATYFDTSSSSDSTPRSAASRTLIAVNAFVIDARWKTVEDVIGVRRSRLAAPYPRSKITAPSRLTPTPQPGESGRFQVANSGSTLAASAADTVSDEAQAPASRATTSDIASVERAINGLSPRRTESEPRR